MAHLLKYHDTWYAMWHHKHVISCQESLEKRTTFPTEYGSESAHRNINRGTKPNGQPTKK